MRLISSLLLCLLLSSPALLAQSKPILESKGDLIFGDEHERIVAHKFLDGENSLLLVGKKTIRILDVLSAKFTETRAIDLPEGYEDKPGLLSPDGRKIFVFGNYDSRRKEDKIKRPPSVWDLQTGKQIAVLDKTAKPIRAAVWSQNGKTLAISSDRYAPLFNDSSSIEVSFWDGETLAFKNSLPTDKAGWWYLDEDGSKCVYSVGEVKGWIPVIDTKYVYPTGPFSVFSAE